MRKYIKSQYAAALESIANYGVREVINNIIYMNREVCIVVKDLHDVGDRIDRLRWLNIDMVEITRSSFDDIKNRFVVKGRAYRSIYYLSMGYEGYALMKDHMVIGDTWYFDPHKADNISPHIDVTWLGLQLPEGAVYNFDIFVARSARGKNVSSLFQNNVLYSLRKKNYTKVYGYVFVDNVPGMWNAVAVNGFRKERSLKVRRLVWYKGVVGKSEVDLHG